MHGKKTNTANLLSCREIAENIWLMEEFIEQMNRINPKCKIILTLMPRYITMEKTLSVFMKDWKEGFESVIKRLQMKYEIHFINSNFALE